MNDDPNAVIESIKTKYLKRIGLEQEELKSQITKRTEYKKNKDFSAADSIRNELLVQGIKLLDFIDKTEWEIMVE